MKTQLKKIRVKEIRITGEHRPLVPERVKVLADSISKIGLKTPPTVRPTKKGYALIAGRHRLEAVKSLGWRDIYCIVMRGDKTERRLWTLAENLHRADLTALQRAEWVTKWEKLIKRQKGAQKAQSRGQDKGLSKTAKGLGMTREEVRRSRQVAGISPKAKRVAEAMGLADNQSALLEVAKESEDLQVAKARQLAKRKRKKANSLSVDEVRQLKKLKRAYERAQEFKEAWKDAATPARQHFVKTVLNKTDDEEEW
jgi:ParB/RepB/Spo0J family partition protein